MNRLYKFFALLLLCVYTGIAQENLKNHTVISGETLLSISKKYDVTPHDLQKANPGAIHGIKENEILIIPESNIKSPILDNLGDPAKTSMVSSSISHTVKSGETKFSLAKRFGLTITQLESQNPQITSGLHVGQVLEIYPSEIQKNSEIASIQSNHNLKKGKTHQVLSGETLFSIASANGLTADELVKANSNTISGILKIGQILWIPGSGPETITSDSDGYVVKYGDTKFSLSKRFNTSVREMERQNPHIVKMLIVGQTISMPSDDTKKVAQSESSTTPILVPTNDVKEVEKNLVIAEVISEAPIQEAERKEEIVVVAKAPSIKPPKSEKKEEPSAVINVPSKKTAQKEKKKELIVVTEIPSEEMAPQEKKEDVAIINTHPEKAIEEPAIVIATAHSDQPFIVYKIQANETVYGLASKAGMSIPKFLELNPQLKASVQIGTYIKMPNDGTASNAVSTPVANTEEALILPKITAGFADLRSSANTSQSKKLLFFLPFSEMEYKNYAINDDNFKTISDDFKRTHLEFYKGANMAIDSIRKMNLKLDVVVVEAESTNQTSKIKSLIQDHNAKDYDAIILPFYKTVEEDIAAFTADRKIPVITASTSAYQNNTTNLYSAVPSINQQRLKVLNYMMAKQAHIIVLSDANRVESKTFIANHVPNADFVSIKKNGSFSEAELKAKFKKDRLNYVIIDSERNSVFLNATNALLSELSNYKLQLAVLEASLIPGDSDVSQKRYQILKMIFPSLIPAKSTESSKQFLSTYQKKYNLLPSANIMLGFDITFDSLLRLMQQQSFENSAINYITEYTQLKFNYEKNTLGGYRNEGIYILQYDSNANIRDAN